MKTSYAATLAVVLATLGSGYTVAANAAAQSPTRAQVLAELDDAQRTGDIIGSDGSGKKLNELYPSLYPAKAAVQGTTRAQVLAELADAQRTGDIIGSDDSGKKLNELHPSLYPAKG